MKLDVAVKYQSSLLSVAMILNVNDNFKSVSFDIDDEGALRVKIVLRELTEEEEELLSYILVEFDTAQLHGVDGLDPTYKGSPLEDWIVEVGDHPPLEHLVFRAGW